MSIETVTKIRTALIKIGHKPPHTSGSQHPQWKDGRSSNKKYVSFLKNKRNRMKRECQGSHTFGEWEALKLETGKRCVACLKSGDEVKLTEDHIVPISKGGSDFIANIQPLCQPCNSSKNAKIISFLIH